MQKKQFDRSQATSSTLSALLFVATLASGAHGATPTTQPESPILRFRKIQSDAAAFRDPNKAKALLPGLADLDHQIDIQEKAVDGMVRSAYLMAAGDSNLLNETLATAASSDVFAASQAKLRLLAVEWITSPDEAAQLRVGDKVALLLKTTNNADPAFVAAVNVFYNYPSLTPAISEASKEQLKTMIAELCPNIPPIRHAAMQTANAKLTAELVGKPLMVSGSDPNQKPFSTQQWKGKVVMVDFWATWCKPCLAELPHVKEVYKKYHDRGFEIVSVSSDSKKEALANFLARDPAMPWQELFDPQAAEDGEWHPLTKKYGVDSIPRAFLIDKNGICRTVDARQNMDTMIPALLAESVPDVSMAR